MTALWRWLRGPTDSRLSAPDCPRGKEPGGVLFELATAGPGFAVDEDPAHLGQSLVLPPFLQADRDRIEAVLPKLTLPSNHV